jgi:hypothetical protein
MACSVPVLLWLVMPAQSPAVTLTSTGTLTPGGPTQALVLGENAFEYRDFEKTIATLNPWVHPPRIADPQKMAKARRLLAISHHVLGDIESSREEFAHLLLLDPDVELDPFVVPPEVIATFREVRTAMRPVLDQIKSRPLTNAESAEIRTEWKEVPPPWTVFLPFGLPQFAHGEPGWGALFASLQSIGLGTNIMGFVQADGTPENDPAYDRWVAVQYVGLGVLAASWIASILHGVELRSQTLTPSAEPSIASPSDPSAERNPPVAGLRW